MTSVRLVSKGRKIERKKIVTVSEFTNKDFRDILFNQVSLVAANGVSRSYILVRLLRHVSASGLIFGPPSTMRFTLSPTP